MGTPELRIVKDPCCCQPEAGIACEVAEAIMNRIHETVRQMATRSNAAAYMSLKEELRNHYLEREALVGQA